MKNKIYFDDFRIRFIEATDNVAIKGIMQTVLKEYDAAKPGTAFTGPELDDMYTAYQKDGWRYLIVERVSDKKIMGGGGFGFLEPNQNKVCELKRMFFLPEIRGLGLGFILIEKLLLMAKKMGFQQAYLETLLIF